MFHLLAVQLGEEKAVLACRRLGWNIDTGSGNLMPLEAVPQHSKNLHSNYPLTR
jgi:hypothetical protein